MESIGMYVSPSSMSMAHGSMTIPAGEGIITVGRIQCPFYHYDLPSLVSFVGPLNA
jgi:hypothetical protein